MGKRPRVGVSMDRSEVGGPVARPTAPRPEPWIARALAIITWWIDQHRDQRQVSSAERDRLRLRAFARVVVAETHAAPASDPDLRASLAAESVLIEHHPTEPRAARRGGGGGVSRPDGLVARAQRDAAWLRSLSASLEHHLSRRSFRLFWALYVERLEPEEAARRVPCALSDLEDAHHALLEEVRRAAEQGVAS